MKAIKNISGIIKDDNIDFALIEQVQAHCFKLISESRCKNFPFHCWQHTLDVVTESITLAKDEHLNTKELEEVIIASYFHDTGNIEKTEGHETLSGQFACSFLKQYLPAERIHKIMGIIQATKLPQHPITLQEQIICDADLSHLGKACFTIKSEFLRTEWLEFFDLEFTDGEWCCLNKKFLEEHHYFTASAQKAYNTQKNINLKKLNKNL